MDFLELDVRVNKLLVTRQFADAEQELLRAKTKASEEGDQQVLPQVLSSLGHLYCAMAAIQLNKAESCFVEAEKITGTAEAKTSTAMMLYWSQRDPVRALAKAKEAIKAAADQSDERFLYQSLGIAGVAQVDLNDLTGAMETFKAVEDMVNRRCGIVVGDETLFLERLSARVSEATRCRRR